MNGIPARLSAASGAYFVVAAILGALGPTRTKVGLLVILSGLVALLVFLGFLHRLPSRTGGRPPTMATYCGLVFLAMQASELAYFGVNYDPATSAPDAGLLQQLIEATFVSSTIFFGLFVLSTAVVTGVAHLVPAWLAWLGGAVGGAAVVAGALGTLAVESHNALAYMAALAWTAVVSVLLVIRPARTQTDPMTAGPMTPPADVAGAV
jgi:hypothetical protein